MADWTARDIPNLAGRTVLVTGANSGIGYAACVEFARHGAHVIMTSRDARKGDEAVRRLKAAVPDADVEHRLLDLSDLQNVEQFTARLLAEGKPIDILINNAGLMMPPRRTTKQGFEIQIGVNHLAHFALTLRLLLLMRSRADARIVTISSGLHRSGKLDFEDLHGERAYSPQGAYAQSKLANVYFGLELDRRLRAIGSPIKSVLAHPGVAKTNLGSSVQPGLYKAVMTVFIWLFAQGADDGALPTLYAATAPGVQGGQFIGPKGRTEMRGSPVEVQPSELGKDAEIAKRLWEKSVELTGVSLAAAA